MNATRRCLSLAKGPHRFVFWYYEGQESEVMASVISMAQEAGGEFDFFDAAVLSYEIGKHIVPEPDIVV